MNFPNQQDDNVKPTVSEIVGLHVGSGLVTVKQIGTALHLGHTESYRLMSGAWDARFALHNTMLRRLPGPVADDLATYFHRGTPYGWVPVPTADHDGRPPNPLADLAGLQRAAARLLDLTQMLVREGKASNQQLTEALAAANAIKRAADAATDGLGRMAIAS